MFCKHSDLLVYVILVEELWLFINMFTIRYYKNIRSLPSVYFIILAV